MIIKITIPEEKTKEIVDAFAEVYGYRAKIITGMTTSKTNPETKRQFMKKKIREYIKETYLAKKNKAVQTYKQTIEKDANTFLTGLKIE